MTSTNFALLYSNLTVFKTRHTKNNNALNLDICMKCTLNVKIKVKKKVWLEKKKMTIPLIKKPQQKNNK